MQCVNEFPEICIKFGQKGGLEPTNAGFPIAVTLHPLVHNSTATHKIFASLAKSGKEKTQTPGFWYFSPNFLRRKECGIFSGKFPKKWFCIGEKLILEVATVSFVGVFPKKIEKLGKRSLFGFSFFIFSQIAISPNEY